MTTTTRPTPAPTPAARHARWAVFALFFTNGALFANIVPRYPEIKDVFALSDPVYGVTVALFPLGAIVSGPFAARVIRRFSSARTAALGTVGIGVLLSLVGIVTLWRSATGGVDEGVGAVLLYALFCLLFFAAGAFDSITDVGQNAHGLRVQGLYGRPIFNSFHGGWSLGAVTGGLMGSAAVALHIPLEWHLIGAAAIFIAVGLLAQRYALPGPDDAETARETPGEGEDGDLRVHTRPFRVGLLLTLLTLLAISGMLAEDATSTWSALYMRDYLGVEAGQVGLAYVVMLGSQAVGRLSADRVTARVGAWRTAQGGGLLMVLGMGVAVAWPSVGTTLAGMALAGFGTASLVPVAMNAANDLPGLRPGSGLTIVTWLGRLAFLCAPPLVGLLVEATSLLSAMAVIPAAGLVAVLVSLLLAPARGTRAH